MSLKFAKSMTGHRDDDAVREFWEHCKGLTEYQEHPALQNESELERVWSASVVLLHVQNSQDRARLHVRTVAIDLSL